MNTRRRLLSNALILTGAAAPLRANATADTAGHPPGGAAYPQTAAEAAAKVTPAAFQYAPGDVRRYGVVANHREGGQGNAQALKNLVAPAGAYRGDIYFPNETGSDVYYFDDLLAFHEDIRIDLRCSTLEFTKAAAPSDSNTGFISALRNFTIENGAIVVNYDMGKVASSAGSALHFGTRGADSAHFAPVYDAELKAPQGNIIVRNVRILSNVPGGNAIELTGGLANVLIENVRIDGQGQLSGGIYYEFGWATSGATDSRQTSHAHNMRLCNIDIVNLKKTSGAAVTLAGAYNCVIENLYVREAAAVFGGTSGESLFYRPWAGVDQVGAKHTIVLRNIVGQGIAGTAINLLGAQVAANGYLAKRKLEQAQQTDLGEFCINGFSLEGSSAGWGIYTTAGKVDLRNGRISGFQRGIVQGDDCTRLFVNAVDVIGCAQIGMQLGLNSATIWKPPRQKMGEVRNCFIAGNGTQRPGAYCAVLLDNCAGFLIENNRIGYEPEHDGVSETSQGNAIQLGEHCRNVVCRGNYVGGAREGVAYYNPQGGDSRGCLIQSAGGVATAHGSWEAGAGSGRAPR